MDEDYVDAVLTLVEQVPHGRVTTYGDLARAVGVAGPRQVGRVMALHGHAVPWWRVVHADGTPATCHDGTALDHLQGEGVPITGGNRVDMQSRVRLPSDDATTRQARIPGRKATSHTTTAAEARSDQNVQASGANPSIG